MLLTVVASSTAPLLLSCSPYLQGDTHRKCASGSPGLGVSQVLLQGNKKTLTTVEDVKLKLVSSAPNIRRALLPLNGEQNPARQEAISQILTIPLETRTPRSKE